MQRKLVDVLLQSTCLHDALGVLQDLEVAQQKKINSGCLEFVKTSLRIASKLGKLGMVSEAEIKYKSILVSQKSFIKTYNTAIYQIHYEFSNFHADVGNFHDAKELLVSIKNDQIVYHERASKYSIKKDQKIADLYQRYEELIKSIEIYRQIERNQIRSS